MKTAIYVRVSTDRQTHESQLKDLTSYANGKDVVWYEDKASGRKMERPGMDKLLKDVRAGKINRIAVYDMSRLGRTARGLTTLFEELINRKCTLVSLRDGVDLLTPSGRLIANVLASVAQFESELRADKIRAGLAAKKARGEDWGNGRPQGSTKWTDKDAKAVETMRAAKVPVSTIVERLKLSRSTVYNIIEHYGTKKGLR